MGTKIHQVFCPRCDRKKTFVSTHSRERALEKLDRHVKLAHPDMEGWDED